MSTAINNILHSVTNVLQIPVVIVLLLFIALTIIAIGGIIGEFFSEHKHMSVHLPKLLDDIRNQYKDIAETISASGLLKTQKSALIEVTKHKEFTPLMREALAENLLEEEQGRYDKKVKYTDMLAKLAPMLGLMGTLIPLGPGIIALGQGDTYTLSLSLQTAFDTTIAGLCVAAVAIIISAIRKRWYNKYMSVLETVMDCVVEMEKQHG